MTDTTRTHDDDAHLISSYSDAEAVEDGVVIMVNERDRCTCNLFAHLASNLPTGAAPPDRWPVSLFDWFRVANQAGQEGNNQRAVAALKGMIGNYSRQAREADTGRPPKIFELWIVQRGHSIVALREMNASPDANDHRCLWLVPNEVGGITAMFPEDY